MPKRKVVAKTDRQGERAIERIRHGFALMEMGHWGLKDWQFELAKRSRVFKELMRQAHEAELARPPSAPLKAPIVLLSLTEEPTKLPPFVPDCFVDVSRLFAVAGRPDPPSFPEWWGSSEFREKGEGRWFAEDRGEAGWFADWEIAAWYAHELDPEQFGVEEVCELLY